jgi:hypothetical protein
MTSTPPEEEAMSSLPNAMKDDELSRRYYFAGFAGLPWLWIVHTLNWYGKQKAGMGARLLQDPDGTFTLRCLWLLLLLLENGAVTRLPESLKLKLSSLSLSRLFFDVLKLSSIRWGKFCICFWCTIIIPWANITTTKQIVYP